MRWLESNVSHVGPRRDTVHADSPVGGTADDDVEVGGESQRGDWCFVAPEHVHTPDNTHAPHIHVHAERGDGGR